MSFTKFRIFNLKFFFSIYLSIFINTIIVKEPPPLENDKTIYLFIYFFTLCGEKSVMLLDIFIIQADSRQAQSNYFAAFGGEIERTFVRQSMRILSIFNQVFFF